MKRFDIRICGKQAGMVEAILQIALCRQAVTEKEKRLLGEVIYALLETVPDVCALIIPSHGLTKEQRCRIKSILSAIAGSYEWEQITDGLDKKKFTVTEEGIIPLICTGFTAKEISKQKKLSFNYIRELIKSIYLKANCHSKMELMNYVKNNAA